MPYELLRSNAGGLSGWRVKNKRTGTFLSKRALPLATAEAQRKAVIISEINRGNMKPFFDGGKVPMPIGYADLSKRVFTGGDTVPAVLQVGEIVIPKQHTKLVEGFLKREGIKLPGM